MRLKRLTLHGYKTFASKTSFEFGEGITAIVGPNGSGKSNIADAIRWVLGEQSYSTLRGKKTTDMIFAGSQKRSRAGMAQAILTLDNSEGWLPIDFSEIEISRRAYRSGENEYLLNGTKVRLRDVSELLATSGLAHRTYTIIGQGLVDQALSLRADERRMLFEEAAGISHYKSKRAETLRRLQETDHNLERLHDIMAEIRPRLTSLRRQASRAENYRQVATDLRHHLRIWYGFRWERSKAELKVHRQASRNAQELWEESRNHHLELQIELRNQRELVNRLSDEMRKLESDREEHRYQLENIRREVAVLSERKSALEQQALELQEELPGLKEQQASASQELAESLKEFQQATEIVVSLEAKLNQYDLKTESLREEVDSYEKQLNRLQSELIENQNQLATTKGRLAQQRQQLSELELSEEDRKELDNAQKRFRQFLDSVTSVETSLENLVDTRKDCREQLERLRKEQLRHESITKSTESDLYEIREQVSALVARKDFLGRLLNHENNLPEKLASAPRLLDHINIPDEYKVAIESALGYRMEALLLEEESIIWEIDEQPSTRISLFVANRIEPAKPQGLPQERGVIGWASELVTFQENSPLAQSILSKVLIVESKREALSLGAKLSHPTIVVSIDGTTVYPAGIVELGSIGALDSVLFREEEWISSNQELASLAERQHSLLRKMETNQNSVASLLLEQERLQEDESRYLMQIEKDRQILGDLRRDFDRARQQHQQIQENHDLRENQSKKLMKLIEAESKLVDRLEEESKRLKSDLDNTQEHLLNLPTDDLSRQRDNLSQQIDNARAILAGKQAVVDSQRATSNQLDALISRRYQKQQNLDDRLNNLNLEEKLEGLHSAKTKSKEIDKELSPLKSELTTQRQAQAQFELKADSFRSQSHELETRFSQSRIELNKIENQIESLKERISADLGLVALSYDDDQVEQSPLPMDDIVEHLPEIQELPDDIEETIQRYRGQLTRMGGINPDAPAEYEATSQRYKQLRQQIEDLINTQQRLRDVIDELDEKTSRAFGATVQKVDNNFGNVFKRLFGGGSAKLILTDPDNLIDSGVEIVARLPRHREQGLALLSGGERSLTATALIFALLKVSPTPFCVLDEVDAMLDEANVNRFRQLLSELSQQTQFILITHNRGTVQVAESVYGVSMGSDSASQVISIRPEDYLVGTAVAALH